MECDKEPKKIVEEEEKKEEADHRAHETLREEEIKENRENGTEYNTSRVKIRGYMVGH